MDIGKFLMAVVLCCMPVTAWAQDGPIVVPTPGSTPVGTPVPAAQPAACVPTCRASYTCVEGTCVSLCNPPCGSNQECTNVGTCVSTQVPQDAMPQRRKRQQSPEQADRGWARGAGVFGVVNAGLIGIMLAAGLSANDTGTEIALGSTVVGYGALTVPIVAIGGGSARNHPAVRGKPGLRTAAWIGYGFFVIDGVLLVGAASAGEEVPEAVAVSAVLLGISVELAFASDAFASANQAERVGSSAYRRNTQIRPFLGLTPERDGGYSGVIGISGALW